VSLLVDSFPLPAAAEEPYEPVLRWLIFTGVSLFAGVALWRYGLVRAMVVSDRTSISLVILALYLVASAHCLVRAVAISREAKALENLAAAPGEAPARLLVTAHIADLALKARARGAGRLDQTLLLRGLAERLAAPNRLGGLAADTAMKLGLLGTIIGFILMLGPVAGLDADDDAALKTAMSTMSAGMAVAMVSTLAGLLGALLIKAQYLIVEAATTRLFWRLVRLTETRIAPALERGHV
jgi:hypothetical protein